MFKAILDTIKAAFLKSSDISAEKKRNIVKAFAEGNVNLHLGNFKTQSEHNASVKRAISIKI